MARASFAKLAPQRRQKLLKAAAEEIAARGLQEASLNRILTRAGISKGVAYHYFNDRDDLLATVLRGHAAPANPIDFSKLSAKTFWTELEGALAEIAAAAARDPAVLAVARAVWALPADRRAQGAFGELWQEMTAFIRAAIARGRELGVVRRDLDEALLASIALAIGEACDRWFLEHPESAGELHSIFDLFRRLLKPEPRRRR